MKVTIGRIVIYNTTEEDRKEMQLNGDNVQKQLPAIIVGVFDENEVVANLKVLRDGNGPDFWLTSIHKGDSEGNWNFPVIQK